MLVAALLTVTLAAPLVDDLASELRIMRDEDQAAMRAVPFDQEHLRTVLVRNTQRLKEIVEAHGWPHDEMVGRDASNAAWLIAQHSDHDREFQAHILELLQPLFEGGLIRKSNYAYLWDRLNDPQRYGTQGLCIAPGDFRLRELEDPDQVDALRASVELGPVQEYVEFVAARCRARAAPN